MSIEKQVLDFIKKGQKQGKGGRSSLNEIIRLAREEGDEKFLKAALKVKEKIKGKGSKYFYDMKTPIKERSSKNTIGKKLKAQRDYAEDSKNIPLVQRIAIEKSGALPKYITNYKKKKGGMVQKKYVNPVKIVDNRKK